MSDTQDFDESPDVSGVALIEVVENQLEDGEPIEVKETLMRLMMSGESRDDALAYIACALSVEMTDVLENGAEFDHKRYAKNLAGLPEMPWLAHSE